MTKRKNPLKNLNFKPFLNLFLIASINLSTLQYSFPLLASPYLNFSKNFLINNPERVCNKLPISFKYYRYNQLYEGTFKPVLTLVPCDRYRAGAKFRAKFEVFKTTGDRKEASVGDASFTFSSYGKRLDIIMVYRGSKRGYYSRDINKTVNYYTTRN